MNMQDAFDHTHKLVIKTLLLLLIIIITTTTTTTTTIIVVVAVVFIIFSRFHLSSKLLLIFRTNLLRCHCSEVLPKKTT